MSLRKSFDEEQYLADMHYEEKQEDMPHKRKVRRQLEEKLERKRLKEEYDELNGDFDWDDFDK